MHNVWGKHVEANSLLRNTSVGIHQDIIFLGRGRENGTSCPQNVKKEVSSISQRKKEED